MVSKYIDIEKISADFIQENSTTADVYLTVRKIFEKTEGEDVVSLEEYNKVKKEYDFTREYIHDNGLEWDLLSKYIRYTESEEKKCKNT